MLLGISERFEENHQEYKALHSETVIVTPFSCSICQLWSAVLPWTSSVISAVATNKKKIVVLSRSHIPGLVHSHKGQNATAAAPAAFLVSIPTEVLASIFTRPGRKLRWPPPPTQWKKLLRRTSSTLHQLCGYLLFVHHSCPIAYLYGQTLSDESC